MHDDSDKDGFQSPFNGTTTMDVDRPPSTTEGESSTNNVNNEEGGLSKDMDVDGREPSKDAEDGGTKNDAEVLDTEKSAGGVETEAQKDNGKGKEKVRDERPRVNVPAPNTLYVLSPSSWSSQANVLKGHERCIQTH
jgi:hypothetical protein